VAREYYEELLALLIRESIGSGHVEHAADAGSPAARSYSRPLAHAVRAVRAMSQCGGRYLSAAVGAERAAYAVYAVRDEQCSGRRSVGPEAPAANYHRPFAPVEVAAQQAGSPWGGYALAQVRERLR